MASCLARGMVNGCLDMYRGSSHTGKQRGLEMSDLALALIAVLVLAPAWGVFSVIRDVALSRKRG